jgi:hypothetical protein
MRLQEYIVDEFLDVLVQPIPPHYTPHWAMLCGAMTVWGTWLPFFQAIVPLEDLVQRLESVENLPLAVRPKWRLDELLQREIDLDGAEDKIVNGYLRRPDKIKFFNSVTVALLPLDANRMLAKGYGDTPQEPDLREVFKKKPWQVANIGGVQIITNTDTPHGYIRWDPKRIFAATIDGQHRLAALRRQYLDGDLPSSALNTKVSILFLVLDPRVGFDIERLQLSGDDNPILTVVREVFIDLNKHAEEVERARRILLDDQEIESRCLRNLLAARVGETEEGRLPLGIVHWQHNVAAKFNIGRRTGPFITTVELLYSIITDLLDLKRPKDPLDENQVRKFITSVEDALDVSNVIASNPAQYGAMKPLIIYAERHHLVPEHEVPFANLPSPYLRAAVEGFDKQFRPLIVGVLTQLKPYKDFIGEVQKRGGIDGDLAFYLVQPEKAQDQARKAWGENVFTKNIDEPLEELAEMKSADWPFYAVFQKGLMRASALAWRHFSVVGGSKDLTVEDFLTKWIAFLDELAERGLLKVKASPPKKDKDRVWAGISLNVGETVRWSESAVQRIAALLVIWWYFYATAKTKVGSFLKKLTAARGNETFPKGKELLGAVGKGLRSVVVRPDEEVEDEEVDKRVDRRLRELILLAKNNAATEEVGEEDEDDTSLPVAEAVHSVPAPEEEHVEDTDDTPT